MSRPERFVIVSLGSIGRRHLANLRLLKPDAEIAVCRLSSASQSDSLPKNANSVFHSIQEAIEFAPIAAIIAGPASTHVAIAEMFAEVGIHLLIEKPLSNQLSTAQKLLKTVERTGVEAMVGYNLRFMPGLRMAKELIDEGRVGQVMSVRAAVGQYLPDWRPSQNYRDSVSAQAELGGGALLELSHEIDYLTWIFGMPDSVFAVGGQISELDMDVEDLVELSMRYNSPEKIISIHLDFLDREAHRELRVIGSESTLCWNAMEDQLAIYDPDSCNWNAVGTTPLADRNQVYISELRHFLDCIETPTSIEIDILQGCKILQVIEAAKNSMRSGKTVLLKQALSHGAFSHLADYSN